jgi:Rieske Fe-S protein
MGTGAVASVFFLPAIGCGGRGGNKMAMAMKPIILDVQKPVYKALAVAGGSLKVPNPVDKRKPIIVIRISDTEVAAFSSKCPHLGCELPLPDEGVITCPCHGSTFDESGKVTHGPSIKDLYRFTASVSGNTITISNVGAA